MLIYKYLTPYSRATFSFREKNRENRPLFSRHSVSNAQHYFVQGDFGHTINPTTRMKLQLRWNADMIKINGENPIHRNIKENMSARRQEGSLLTTFEKTFFKGLSTYMMLRQGWVDKHYYSSPYLGMEYQLNETHDWKIKFNASHLIKYPTLNDLYYVPGGNPHLKPEKSLAFESATSFKFNWRKIRNEFKLGAYRADVKNWIIWLPTLNGFWTPSNIRRVKTYGLETEWKVKKQTPRYNFQSIAHFTWNRTLNYGERQEWPDESIGKQLVYIPEFSGNWNGYFAYKDYYISYTFNYYSTRHITSSNEKTLKRDLLPPCFINDLSIGKESIPIGKRLTLAVQFKIYNLFNEEYRTILRRPMPGRNYHLTLTANL